MKGIFKHIEGDRTIWALVAILALFSFMPVYSASANLVSVVGGSTLGYLLKHVLLLFMQFIKSPIDILVVDLSCCYQLFSSY
jgi:cell division protein FtsW